MLLRTHPVFIVLRSLRPLLWPGFMLLLATALCACGGTKMLKEPKPMAMEEPLTTAGDARLTVSLEGVIVRDGAGTWARNADWDEYIICVHNRSAGPIEIVSIVVADSRNAYHSAIGSRRQLVKASRETARRYADAGIEVRAGLGGSTLAAVGGASGLAGATAGVASVYGSTAAVAASVGAMVIAPVVVTGGIIRGVNNRNVSAEIARRQTVLPQVVEPGATVVLDLFFPIAPSPVSIELVYRDVVGHYLLVVDTAAALDGLHLATDTEAR